jgi:hypothetical protein
VRYTPLLGAKSGEKEKPTAAKAEVLAPLLLIPVLFSYRCARRLFRSKVPGARILSGRATFVLVVAIRE